MRDSYTANSNKAKSLFMEETQRILDGVECRSYEQDGFWCVCIRYKRAPTENRIDYIRGFLIEMGSYNGYTEKNVFKATGLIWVLYFARTRCPERDSETHLDSAGQIAK